MKNLNRLNKLFLVVLFVVGLGTVFLQVPAIIEQKGAGYDATAADDLQLLKTAISSKYSSSRKLPSSLSDVTVDESVKGRLARYEYKPNQSKGSYELCATFKTDTTAKATSSSKSGDEDISSGASFSSTLSEYGKYQKHSKGHVCFTEKVAGSSIFDDYFPAESSQTDDSGDVFSTYSGIQSKAKDTEIQTDINAIHAKLEMYFNENNTYPSLTQLKDSSWRKTNLQSADDETFKGPNGETLGSGYNYTTTPSTCKNTATSECTSYTLSARLSSGTNYTKKSLN